MPKDSMPKDIMPNSSMPKRDYAKKQYAKRLYAKRQYAKRGLCHIAVCQKGTMPKDIMPNDCMPNDIMPKYRGARTPYLIWFFMFEWKNDWTRKIVAWMRICFYVGQKWSLLSNSLAKWSVKWVKNFSMVVAWNSFVFKNDCSRFSLKYES